MNSFGTEPNSGSIHFQHSKALNPVQLSEQLFIHQLCFPTQLRTSSSKFSLTHPIVMHIASSTFLALLFSPLIFDQALSNLSADARRAKSSHSERAFPPSSSTIPATSQHSSTLAVGLTGSSQHGITGQASKSLSRRFKFTERFDTDLERDSSTNGKSLTCFDANPDWDRASWASFV